MKTQMKFRLVLAVGVCALTAGAVQYGWSAPMRTAFTYQGRLLDDNIAAEGAYDMQFKLYDDPNVVIGTQIGSTIDLDAVEVVDGYFIAELDFGGGVFDGNARWLQIAVRPGSSTNANDFVALSPLRELSPAPYALYAAGGGVSVPLELNGAIASPDAVIKGTNTDTGYAVIGKHNGSGNYGYLGGSVTGVYGEGSGLGVLGFCSGDGYGVYGSSPSGTGVYGVSNTGFAGRFQGDLSVTGKFLDSTNDAGTAGQVLSSMGLGTDWINPPSVTVPLSLNGSQASPGSIITATNTADGYGLYGSSSTGTGVFGYGSETSSIGVSGSGDGYGIYGYSSSGIAVYGYSTSGLAGYFQGDLFAAGALYDSSFEAGTAGQVLSSTGSGTDWINPPVSSGDITAVNPGTGLTGGGESGDVELAVETPLSLSGSVAEPGAVISGTNTGDGYAVYGKNGLNYGYLGGDQNGVLGYGGIAGIGVVGGSGSGHGVYGTSQSGYGVYGYSNSGYAGYFNGNVYVELNVSAFSFTDRTPYPKDLATAYEAVMSMERLPDGLYQENNKEQQLDHSKLSGFLQSADGNRDLSATVSCQNEVLKDLVRRTEELEQARATIGQLEQRLAALESMIQSSQPLTVKRAVQ